VIGTDRPLDVDRARRAYRPLARSLGVDEVAAAVTVHSVASAEIAAAVQRFLFYRGIDPAGLTMLAFGGTGPLHATEVADIVGRSRVIVPRAAGVFTAVGLLSAEIGQERSRHVGIALENTGGGLVEAAL